MTLPPIIIDFIGRDGKFQAVAAGVESRLGAIQSRIAAVGTRMQMMGDRFQAAGRRMSYLSAGVGASVGGLYMLAKGAAQAGDAAAKAARQAGVGVEYWQRHAYAIGQVTDITEGELSTSMTRLTRLVGEAASGSETASASLQRLGLSQQDLAQGTVTTEEAFDAYLSAVDKAKSPTEAAALSFDIFGKSGTALGAQLAGAGAEMEGLRSEAERMGAVIGEDAAAQAETFMDSVQRIGKRLEVLRQELAEKLIPVFNDVLFPMFENKIIPAFQTVVGWVADAATAFGNLSEPVQNAALIITGAFAVGGPVLIAVGAVMSAVGALVLGPAAPFVILAAIAGSILVAWQTWGDDFQAAIGPAIDWVSEKFKAFMALLDGMVSKIKGMADAVTNFFSVSRQEMDAMDFSGAEGLGFGTGGTGGLDIGGGGGGGGGGGIGRNLADGLASGLMAGLAERAEGLRAAFGTVVDLAREVYQTQSPSLVFAGIGMNIGEGLAAGLSSAQGLVSAATRVLTGVVPKETAEAVSSILGSMSTLFTKAKGFGIAQALVNIGIGMSEALKLPFPANIAAMAKTAASGAQALQTIKGASPSGGGSISGGGGGGGGAAAAPSRPQEVVVRAQGPLSDLLNGVIGGLAEQLRKDFGDSGYVLASGVR